MRKSILFSSFSVAGLAALTFATAAAADGGVETVVVTATRVPTPELQVASSITVITAEDIALKQEQTLPDVLADVPGLNVVQTGAAGGETSVFMRGTNSDHVKVLIDGIDVSDVGNPNDSFDFGQLLTPDIARVEILRGPQSGLYGSDAIGGVINIITKSGEGPAQFTADVEGGSFDTFNQSLGVSGSEGALHYAANVEHFYSGANPVTPLDIVTPGEVRNDNRYDNTTASTKLGYDVADNFDLGFVGRYTNSLLHLTGDNYIPFPAVPDTIQSTSAVVEYFSRATAHLVLFDGFFEETLGIAYGSTSSEDFSPDDGESPFGGDRIKVDWQGNLKFSNDEILVLGAERERDDLRVPFSASITIDSGYAELQSTLFPDFFNSAAVRYDSNSNFGDKFTFREAPAYVIAATGTKLKGSIGTGFKAPSLSELYESFPPSFFANPDLRPETSTGYDAGFEQSLFADQAQFGATWFHNDIKNLIDDNATFTSYTNIDRAKTEGVEAFAAYRPLDTVDLRVDYTYTEATGTQPNNGIFNQQLLRRPKNKLSGDVRWQATKALSLDVDVLYVGPWEDINRESFSDLNQPGYTTVNVAVNYDINDMFTAYGRVTNLFDTQYQDPNGFLRPGRGFFVGLKAKI